MEFRPMMPARCWKTLTTRFLFYQLVFSSRRNRLTESRTPQIMRTLTPRHHVCWRVLTQVEHLIPVITATFLHQIRGHWHGTCQVNTDLVILYVVRSVIFRLSLLTI